MPREGPNSRVSSLLGHTVGKYELLEQLGAGAMARVYLARDKFTEREVAVKIANPESGKNDKRSRIARKLFFNEAKAAGMLHHPNIVQIFDAGVQQDLRYIVMEYVPGGLTLDDYTSRDSLLGIQRVIGIMLNCAIAFDYAHRKGVIHRDIKPKNILMGANSEIKIADFGVAMLTDMDMGETQVTGYVGSPLYMSPEQLRGEAITPQADLFALGVVMYELLTSRHPFAAGSIDAIARQIGREPHRPLLEVRPNIPPVLSHIIDRLLKKHPAGRYETGLDLAGDLSLLFEHINVTESELGAEGRFARARELEFFQRFDDRELREVLNGSNWLTFAAGSELGNQGRDVESFYVVVRGEVGIQQGRTRLETLTPGSCFGDPGPFSKAGGLSSVVARTDVVVMQIHCSFMDQASAGCCLNLHRAFLASTSARLTCAIERIAEFEASLEQ